MIISAACRNVSGIQEFKSNNSCTSGDILLAEVVSLGNYKQIETKTGDLVDLNAGDKILVAQGYRYSTQQYELVPSASELILGSLGGVVGRPVSHHVKIKEQTVLKHLGYAVREDGTILNLKHFSLQHCDINKRVKTIVVLGSDMDSGKTTCAAWIANKLRKSGYSVNYGKITGTARLKDLLYVKQFSQGEVLDFTDCGHASTWNLSLEEIKEIINKLYYHLSKNGANYIIFELADGLLQRETKMIIENKLLNGFHPQIYFCCKDSLSVAEAQRLLLSNGLQIDCVSGLVANSQLGINEVKSTSSLKCISTYLPAKQ